MKFDSPLIARKLLVGVKGGYARKGLPLSFSVVPSTLLGGQ